LGNITAGTKTIITTFEVDTAFDGNAVITVGTSNDNSLLMSDSYAEIEVTGSYQTTGLFEFASDTSLNIYVTQGGATTGTGKVLVSVVDGPVVNGGTINYGAGGSSGIALADLSVATAVSPSGNGSLSYNNSTGVFTFTPADLSSVVSTYGDSNVVTLLSSFGSNTITTTGNVSAGNLAVTGNVSGNIKFTGANVILNNGTGAAGPDEGGELHFATPSANTTLNGPIAIDIFQNKIRFFETTGSNRGAFIDLANCANSASTNLITSSGSYGDSNVVTLLSSFGSNTVSTTGNVSAGNITSGAGKSIFLGNTSSSLRQLGSNASINLGGGVTLIPDTSASGLNGVQIGGNGYLLGPNGARNITLNYSANGGVGFQSNITVGTAGIGGAANIAGDVTTGVNALFAGVTNTILSNTIAAFSASVNGYTQVTLQNKSTGADATADFVITADNGSDTVNYADFGIINSGYDNTTPTNSLGNIVYAADTYLYAQGNASNIAQPGGNIAIGTTVSGKTVKIFAGGANSTAIVGTFSGTAGLAITGNISATGITKAEQIHEIFTTKTSATGTVTHDCSTGQVFSHSSISANFTANFTNLNLDSGYGTTITLVLNQGGTAYIPNAVQIGGVGQTINWQGGSAPSGNANKKDVVSFSILNSSGTYTVLGQLTTFG
jgi:hypothetical protein